MSNEGGMDGGRRAGSVLISPRKTLCCVFFFYESCRDFHLSSDTMGQNDEMCLAVVVVVVAVGRKWPISVQ